MNRPQSYQILGMSATMSGLDMLKKWLDTEIFECQFRPVPLSEYLQMNHKLMDKDCKVILDFQALQKALPQDLSKGLFGGSGQSSNTMRNDNDYVSEW